MTIRYMADSIDGETLWDNIVDVPGVGPQIISLTAGYANGTYHDSSQNPRPTDVTIDVNGSAPGADVLDIETGDATPQQSAQWVHDHNSHGGTVFPAILYCNRSTITTVANVLQANGLRVGVDYKWWISTLDGTTAVPDMTGVVAIQAWGAKNFDRNIDLSIVYDDSWKISEDDVSFSEVIGVRPDGSPVEAKDALLNIYLGSFYGGGDSGKDAVFPTVNALNAKVDALASVLAQVAAGEITAAEIVAALDTALANHIQVTGTVQISGQ